MLNNISPEFPVYFSGKVVELYQSKAALVICWFHFKTEVSYCDAQSSDLDIDIVNGTPPQPIIALQLVSKRLKKLVKILTNPADL
jgi:hypothetical protein